jgi:nucleotide-binding universal stress UspA family protein
MFERILVPLDGSKVGEAALPVIEELISKLSPEIKVEVTLFRAVPPTHWIAAGEMGAPVLYTEGELQTIKQEVTGYLDKAGEGLRSKGVTVKTMAAAGNPAVEILKATDEIGADLVAMSTHGRAGLSRLAFGSVTDKILRQANVPVITVRAPEGTANQ